MPNTVSHAHAPNWGTSNSSDLSERNTRQNGYMKSQLCHLSRGHGGQYLLLWQTFSIDLTRGLFPLQNKMCIFVALLKMTQHQPSLQSNISIYAILKKMERELIVQQHLTSTFSKLFCYIKQRLLSVMSNHELIFFTLYKNVCL